MPNPFSSGALAGTQSRQQRENARVNQVNEANNSIKGILVNASNIVKAWQSGQSNMTHDQLSQNIQQLIAPAARTASLAQQTGLQGVMAPEAVISLGDSLLRSASQQQIAQKTGVATGTEKVYQAGAVTELTGANKRESLLGSGAIKAEPKGTTVNVSTGENALLKAIGKGRGEEIIKQRDQARQAKVSLGSIQEARKILDEGMVSGAFANYQVGLGKALQAVGINYGKTPVDNAQAFAAAQAKQVAQIIQAFGAGTGLSDADREFATKAAGADFTMTEEAIKRIIDINERAYTNIIKTYNADVSNMTKKHPELAGFGLEVEQAAPSGWSITPVP